MEVSVPQAPSFQAHITSLLVCGDAFTDEKGRIHVYSIFDTVGAASFPFDLSFTVFCKVQGEGTHTAFFKIVDSLDEEIIKTDAMPFEVSFTKGHSFFLGVATRFGAPGLYKVKGFLDGMPEIEVPLMVRRAEEALEKES
jgi:hypothetical protein